MQSLGKIVQCAPAIGAKMWFFLLPAGCREAVNAGIKCTDRRKSGFSPRRFVAPIHVKLGRANGHVGPLGCAELHLNRHREWECGPKISKISTFMSLISKNCRDFYAPNA